MRRELNIDGYSDEELIRKYSVKIRGKTFVRARVLDAIGKRKAQSAKRRPGDPGTPENPVFSDGHAYIYSATNQLILWEDYRRDMPVQSTVPPDFAGSGATFCVPQVGG